MRKRAFGHPTFHILQQYAPVPPVLGQFSDSGLCSQDSIQWTARSDVQFAAPAPRCNQSDRRDLKPETICRTASSQTNSVSMIHG